VASSDTGAAVAARLRREGYDWRERVRAVAAPSLVIHGTEDALPPSAAEALASLLPGSRLELIPGAGHMPFWEAPERFFRLVNEFLPAPPT
jgi:proline iminopeptidase